MAHLTGFYEPPKVQPPHGTLSNDNKNMLTLYRNLVFQIMEYHDGVQLKNIIRDIMDEIFYVSPEDPSTTQ
jgi:hypothetical protein